MLAFVLLVQFYIKKLWVVAYLALCIYSACNHGCFALVYCLQCGKSCVIIELDVISSYLMDTSNIILAIASVYTTNIVFVYTSLQNRFLVEHY